MPGAIRFIRGCFLLLLGAGLLVVGCGFRRGYRSHEKAVALLSSSGPWSEKRQILFELAKPPHRKENLEWLIDNWGRVNHEYDIAVLGLIGMSLKPGLCELDDEFAGVLLRRIEKDPALLRQVFWDDRWLEHELCRELRSTAEPSRRYLVAYEEDLFSRSVYGWEKLFWLLKVASMLGRPELVVGADAENLPTRWDSIKKELEEDAPYYYFDSHVGIFRLDEDAKRRKKSVSPSRQACVAPLSRLPPREYDLEKGKGTSKAPG